jgi:UDP-N-acetylglucosamine 2-epimerase (non-hydrolysing)
MEEGSVIMTGMNFERISQSIHLLEFESGFRQQQLKNVSDYQAHNVSEKVVRILHSYTDYVNRTIWKKY